MRNLMRAIWSRALLKGIQHSARYENLDRLYLIDDPWNLRSDEEQYRFIATNALIKQLVPDCSSLLEVGCGEGAQTKYLVKVCDSLTGIDVSKRAIERARVGFPQCTFAVLPAEKIKELYRERLFSICVACEVLYYTRDPQNIIDIMCEISESVLVTVYENRMDGLIDIFKRPSWRQLDSLQAGSKRWYCYYWTRN